MSVGSGVVLPLLARLAPPRDAVNLNLDLRQRAPYRGAARGILGEELSEDLVHGVEILQVGQKDADPYDILQRALGRFEDRLNVLERPPGFRADIAEFELIGHGIDRPLTSHKDEIAVDNRLRVDAPRTGSMSRTNHFAHVISRCQDQDSGFKVQSSEFTIHNS